jgi:hypothetical protein
MVNVKTKRCDIVIIDRYHYRYDDDVYVLLVRHQMPKRMYICISSNSRIVVVMLHGSNYVVSSLNEVAAVCES